MTNQEKEILTIKQQIAGLIRFQSQQCAWQNLPFDQRAGDTGLLVCLRCTLPICLYDSAKVLASLGVRVSKSLEVVK